MGKPSTDFTLTPEQLERYEEIVARAETYFDHFRDNPEYDFTKTGGSVCSQQSATEIAYRRYAEGSLTVEGVHAQVKMLRQAFRI